MRRYTIFIFLWAFCANTNLFAQPETRDYFLGYGGAGLFAASQIYSSDLAPNNPKWKKPNSFDLFFRNTLKWQDNNLDKAAFYSDLLLKGIFLPSIFWTPLLSENKYSYHFLLNLQVAAANGLLTNITKFITGRERPYSYFGTFNNKSNDKYLSFYSGHASTTFAIGVTSGMMLEEAHPKISGLIWTSTLTLAAVTAYFRVASDRHYMSDVLIGTVMGSFVAYMITKNQKKRFFKDDIPEANLMFYYSFNID